MADTPSRRDFLLAGAALAAGGWTTCRADGQPGAGASLVASPERGWPQWRGPRRDGISDEKGLLQSWPAAGPRLVWKAGDLGKGFSSPIVAGGRLYVAGDVGDTARVFALDLNGRPLWQAANGLSWTGPFPGARGSCAYAAGRVYHMNAHGRIGCYDAATGREAWSADTHALFEGKTPTWGRGECLLVDNGKVLAVAGGRKALAAALDARTGAVVWRTPPLLLGPSPSPGLQRVPEPAGEADPAGYGSPLLLRFGGRRLLVGSSLRHAFCLDATTGALLWTRPMPTTYQVVAMTPVLVGDGVFVSAPDGPAGRLLRLKASGGGVDVEEAWRSSLDTCHSGVVHVGGVLYGSWYRRPAWGCVDARTGAPRSQSDDRTMGSMAWADGRLYFLTQGGEMRLLRPTAGAPEVVGRFSLVTGRRDDVWAHPVICGGRLYVRDHETLWSYDVRAGRT